MRFWWTMGCGAEIRWQAVLKHCTIFYGSCEDSEDGQNFESEYWRKLQPSDFVPRVQVHVFLRRGDSESGLSHLQRHASGLQ